MPPDEDPRAQLMLGMWDRGPHVNPIASDLGDSDGEYIQYVEYEDTRYTHYIWLVARVLRT